MAIRGTTKFESNKQEKRVADELGGKTVIGSGSLWGAKGDVRTEDYLIECKTTKKTSYPLSADTWLKIEREATRDGLRIPVMCIDLEDGKDRLAVFRYHPYIEADGFEFERVKTHSNSVSLNWEYKYCIVSFDSHKDMLGKRLCVVPWEYFLSNVMEEEHE